MSEVLCSVADCSNAVANIRGWCVKHYQQWRRHGDPEWRDKKSKVCSVEGCERKHYCRGFCSMHHQRWFKYGDPTICKMPLGRTMEDRFWSKVKKAGKHECWLWEGGKDYDGYGIFASKDNRSAKAHRVSYEMEYGKQTSGQILHRCDNRSCVNPRHLYVGTPMDNMQDKIVRGRAVHHKGEECYQAKLTGRDVRRVRKLHGNGVSQAELARKYRVTPGNISAIITRRSWKHI